MTIESDEQKPTAGEPHKDYRPYIEYGFYVWYRTTSSRVFAINRTTGKVQRTGTRMSRIVTNATTYEEACLQLDRALEKPKKEPVVRNKNQKSLFK